MSRLEQLNEWLAQVLPGKSLQLSPASADASFRRYFRVEFEGSPSLIAMDAPPPQEDCRPFVQVAQLFLQAGLHVPKVLAEDLQHGFLLLDDLGNDTYLQALNADTNVADPLYRDAFNALIQLQQASQPGVLPPYDEALLTREMQLFPDWYIARHLA